MTDFPTNFHGRDRYGPYTVLAVDGDDRLVRYDDGREARRPVVLLRLAHNNREQFDQFAPSAPAPSAAPGGRQPPARGRRPPADEPTFSQAEVLPIIARLIRKLAGDPPEYVPHDHLIAALLGDDAGRRHVDRARELQGDDRRREVIAADMVARFSQRITGRDSPYAADFERKKLGGAWAYRPRRPR